MDWSQVTALTIPEGNVKQVSVNGVVLWKKSLLPRFVEYIHFDGNSWIDTGYIPSSNTRVVGKVLFTRWNDTVANYVFGVFGDSRNFGFNVGSARAFFNIPWGANAGIHDQEKGIEPTFNVKYNFDISKEGCYINDVEYLDTSKLTETFQAQKTMFVGWSNGTSAKQIIGKVTLIQIFESGVLIQDLRPCLDPKGVVCMYDMVTKKYFYNKGTGTLTAGPIILPSGYTQLEYIESTGTQYIDLGINKIREMECNLVAQLTDTTISGFPTLIGAMKTSDNFKVVVGINSSLQFYSQAGGAGGYIYGSVKGDLNKHSFKILTSGSSISSLTIDGNTVNGHYALTTDSDIDMSLYLFARHKQDGTVYQFIKMRCYELTIKYANKIVRNLIPAMRNSDSKVGMYDTVTRQFFTNAGTGEFIAGAVTDVGEGTTTLKISANVPTKTSQLTNDSDSLYIKTGVHKEV